MTGRCTSWSPPNICRPPGIAHDVADNVVSADVDQSAAPLHTMSPYDSEAVVAVAQFEAALSLLRGQLDRGEARIGRQEAELTALREAVRRDEKALDRAYAAEAERKGRGGRWRRLRADLAGRRGQGRWRRLRAAWRRE